LTTVESCPGIVSNDAGDMFWWYHWWCTR